MRVPAAIAAIPLLAGSAAGVLLVDHIPERLILAFAATAIFGVLAAFGFLEEDLPPAVVVTLVCAYASAGLSIGLVSARAAYAPSLLQWFESRAPEASAPVAVEGIIREDAALSEFGASLAIGVRRVSATGGAARAVLGGVRMAVGGRVSATHLAQWRAGRVVRISALLRRPTVFRDPGVQDDTRALARRGVVLIGSVKSASLVEVLDRGSVLEEVAAAVRARVRRVLSARIGPLSSRSAAIATAILIGDRTGLSEPDERRLRDGGTYHVIAISGGNIAILTAMLMGIARLLRLPLRIAAAVSIAVLLFYGEVAGGAASVERAVSGAVVFLAAYLLDHRGSPLNTISVAGVVGAAASPVATLDPGFLLSFGATAGIMLGVPRLMPPDRQAGGWIHSAGRAAWGLLAATLCAEIALTPIAAVLFSRITAAGLLLNFAAIPLMTVVQAGSMVLAVLGDSGRWAADPIALIVHRCATGLVESARLVDVAPWLARDVSPPAWWLCASYYLACAGVLWLRQGSLPRFGAAGVLMLSGFLIVASPSFSSSGQVPPPAESTLRVVVLDVGQGDATILTLPDGTSLLIDCGGLAGTSFDMGGRVVLPALRALGVRRLHALVLTHGDPDHIGGAEAVTQRMRPHNVWEGVPVPPHSGLRALMARAGETHAVWRTVRPGDLERVAGVEIRILHPPPPDWERQRVRNDDSIVIQVDYGDVSILLPGDIGAATERTLVRSLQLRPTVILKAAHHGSATSSSDQFLEATRPDVVVFSSGRDNRFGHPASVVVERVARRGVPMLNTADDGAVFVETDGKKVEVTGWTGRTMTIR
ncbi:MAG: DNA internalization-related competence protein ComEC/Rec2 [Vicinamibacterales bacterium]